MAPSSALRSAPGGDRGDGSALVRRVIEPGGYGGACPYDTSPCPSGSASAFVPPQAASCVDRKKKKCNKFVRKQKTAKKCLKNKWKKKCKKTCNAC